MDATPYGRILEHISPRSQREILVDGDLGFVQTDLILPM
jgi:hypothetical protein